jgi:hypothetical protein
MNIQEAIDFLRFEIKCLEKEIEICNRNDDIDIQVIEANKNIIIKYNQVIILLQQEEKYRKMWEEVQKRFGEEPIELHNLNEFMDDIKDKYFPKETNEKH